MLVVSKVPKGTRCPHCKRSHILAKGRVPHSEGPKQRYVCFDCAKSFYLKKKATKKTKRGGRETG